MEKVFADIRLAAFLDLFLTVLLRCHGLVLEKGLGLVILFPLRRIRLPGHFNMVLTPLSLLRSYCRPIPCTVSLRGIFQRVPARQVFLPETRQGRAEIPPTRILDGTTIATQNGDRGEDHSKMARQAYVTGWGGDDKTQTLLRNQAMASQQYCLEQVKECV